MLRTRPFRAALPLLAALALRPSPSAGQAVDIVAGSALGALGGTYLSIAVVTVNARAGRFLFSPDDLRWELLPIPAGTLAGGLLAARDADRFWRATGWGLGGLAAGALAGAAAGRALWGPAEGSWSGAVLGGAAGLLAGSVVGALRGGGDVEGTPVLSFAVPTPW